MGRALVLKLCSLGFGPITCITFSKAMKYMEKVTKHYWVETLLGRVKPLIKTGCYTERMRDTHLLASSSKLPSTDLFLTER